MKFNQWIKECGGPDGTAAVLNVTRRVVYQWLSGQSLPRFSTCKKIQKITGGKVTIADVLKYYISKN